MNRRAAVLALAVTITIPAATAATAAAKASSHGAAVSAAAHAKHKGHGPGRKAPKSVVYAGTLTAVDTAAATLTVTVTGGNDKSARGTSVTLAVPAGARITRDDKAATLAELVVGDHLNVKTARTGARTALRVSAESAETEPTPAPSTSPSPSPSPSATA